MLATPPVSLPAQENGSIPRELSIMDTHLTETRTISANNVIRHAQLVRIMEMQVMTSFVWNAPKITHSCSPSSLVACNHARLGSTNWVNLLVTPAPITVLTAKVTSSTATSVIRRVDSQLFFSPRSRSVAKKSPGEPADQHVQMDFLLIRPIQLIFSVESASHLALLVRTKQSNAFHAMVITTFTTFIDMAAMKNVQRLLLLTWAL